MGDRSERTASSAARTTPVYAQMILLTCGACGHEEVRDESGYAAMHTHLADAHGTTWEPVAAPVGVHHAD